MSSNADNADNFEQLERDWDKAWQAYVAGSGGEPNDHPKADHPYNVDRKKYI